MPYGYRICFTERSRHRVVAWDPDTNNHEILAGEGGRTDPTQRLSDPYGLTANAQGALFVADKLNDRICQIQKGKIKKLECYRGREGASKSKRKALKILNPAGLFFEHETNSMLAAFSAENVICRIHSDGEVEVVLGIAPGTRYDIVGCAPFVPPEKVAETPLYMPVGVTKRKDGTIFFIERGFQTVREFHPKRGMTNLFTARYDPELDRKQIPQEVDFSSFRPLHPTALAVDGGDVLYLADGVCGCVWQVDLQAKKLRKVTQSFGQGGPVAIAFGKDGTLWVHDGAIGAVQGFRSTSSTWNKVEEQAQTVQEGLPCVSLGGAGIVCV